MTTSVHEKETYAKFTLLDKFSDETESNNCLSFSDFLQREVTRNFAIDGESVHYRSSQVSLTVLWYPFLLLDGERRWEKHCYPSHVTQPHPFLPPPLLAFCKVSRTHFPSRAETDIVKDCLFCPRTQTNETTRTRIQFFHWGIQTKLRRLNLSIRTSKHQFSELSFIHFFWFLLWEFGVNQNTSSRWYFSIFLSPLCLRMY